MPSNADGKWRTYTNVLYANRVILMPVYAGQRQTEREAEAVYAKLLPTWSVVKINADPLISVGGGLHCIAMNLTSVGDLRGQERTRRLE